MREDLSQEVLKYLVTNVCEGLNTFSAFDVTSILRNKFPNTNIMHDDVRREVYNYSNANNIASYDNGKYHVFTKSLSSQQQCCKTVTVTLSDSNNLVQKAKNLAAKLSNQAVSTIRPLKRPNTKTVDLQTRGRINLTEVLRDHFKGQKIVYLRKLWNGDLSIDTKDGEDAQKIYVDSGEVRFRTGFTSDEADIVFTKNHILIRPTK